MTDASGSATRSTDELADDLGAADFNLRAQALGELVRRGNESTAALVRVLGHADVEVRARAAQGLGEIADPSSADLLAGMLGDADGRIRARGAQGLARLGDPRALDALVRTIDDFEDVLHSPDTLSTAGLIGLGPAALLAVAPLLSAQRSLTRQRAFLVIERIVSRARGPAEFQARWRELGSYDPTREGPERDDAAAQLRGWLARQFPH
jgi:HEAT repeat protein